MFILAAAQARANDIRYVNSDFLSDEIRTNISNLMKSIDRYSRTGKTNCVIGIDHMENLEFWQSIGTLQSLDVLFDLGYSVKYKTLDGSRYLTICWKS